MSIFKLILLVGLVGSQVSCRHFHSESVESVEDNLAISFEESSNEFSDELPASLTSYSPEVDGDPNVWVDNYIKSLPPGYSPVGGEAALRKQMNDLYQQSLGQPLPDPTPDQLKKIDKGLNDAEIKKTNKYRRLHSAQPVVYDEKLAAFAQNFAEESADRMAAGQAFYHNPDAETYKIGENMAGDGPRTQVLKGDQYVWPDDWVPENKGQASDMWYSEIDAYKANGDMPSDDPATGHFTQTVWKATKKMGCGQKCYGNSGEPKQCVVICNYYPAGNMDGNQFYQSNVIMN